MDSDDDTYWREFGDLRTMQGIADNLPPPLRATDVTPWGITIADEHGREFAVLIEDEQRAVVTAALLLPRRNGVRSARNIGETVVATFSASPRAVEWRAQGFEEPRCIDAMLVAHGGVRRCGIEVTFGFPIGIDALAKLAWAAERRFIEVPIERGSR